MGLATPHPHPNPDPNPISRSLTLSLKLTRLRRPRTPRRRAAAARAPRAAPPAPVAARAAAGATSARRRAVPVAAVRRRVSVGTLPVYIRRRVARGRASFIRSVVILAVSADKARERLSQNRHRPAMAISPRVTNSHVVINRRPGSPDCSGDAYALTVHSKSKSKSKAVYDHVLGPGSHLQCVRCASDPCAVDAGRHPAGVHAPDRERGRVHI